MSNTGTEIRERSAGHEEAAQRRNAMKRFISTTMFAAALVLLLMMSARAASADDVVVPDKVYDRQPFSFAVPQTVEGEVISVQTADGVVVQKARADKYGRLFLASGLPAGAYLISTGKHGQPLGKIEIQQRATDALKHVPQSMQVQNPPQALKLSDQFSLTGHGFSPNYSDMQVSLTGSGKTEAPIVLAATEDQLKLAPIKQLQPGAAQLRATNQATGHSTDVHELLLYNIHGNLERRKLHSGDDATQLVVNTQPANLPLKVRASVVSGPVDFGNGRKQTEAITNNGQTVFPVHAEKGAGPFQLNWELADLTSGPPEDANNPPVALGPSCLDGEKCQGSKSPTPLKKRQATGKTISDWCLSVTRAGSKPR